MADSCALLNCIGLVKNFIYFEDLEADCFTSSREEARHLCYSRENHFLILNSDGQLEFKNLTTAELLQPESKFNIRLYKDSSIKKREGRVVMLYANHNQKKMVVCCRNNEICTEEMDPPGRIAEDQHKALFYLVDQSSSYTYMFESTVHPNSFLAFQRENAMLKLVLREKSDEVDENCQFSMDSK